MKGSLASVALALRDEFGIRDFVETGTHTGVTTAWAADHFARVFTLEIHADTQRQAKANLGPRDNVAYVLGDSASALPGVLRRLSGPALFWLDAHKGGGYFGEGDDCPVLAELDAINASRWAHFVFIDDARGFMAPVPKPFDPDAWPDLMTVLDRARARRPTQIVIFDDVIMCVPEQARRVLRDAVRSVRPKL